jgi:small subunit ribosomal protein S13
MYKYKDTKLYLRGNLVNSLSGIYGLGIAKSSFITESLGFGKGLKVNYLNSYFYNCILTLLKSKYILESRLKELELQRLEFFYANGFIKGLRIFDGLPVRGQRTHTNASTPKRIKPFSEKYNDAIVERQQRIASFAKKKQKKKSK